MQTELNSINSSVPPPICAATTAELSTAGELLTAPEPTSAAEPPPFVGALAVAERPTVVEAPTSAELPSAAEAITAAEAVTAAETVTATGPSQTGEAIGTERPDPLNDVQALFHRHDFSWFIPMAEKNMEGCLIIAFDSEYVSGALDECKKNAILSFQAVTLNPCTGQTRGFIADCEGKERFTLKELMDLIVRDAEVMAIVPPDLKGIFLCAHFSVAELTSLGDFGDLRKQFDGIRSTYASVKEPLKLTVALTAGERSVELCLLDTMLLAPAKGGSLSAIGKVLGLAKVELPEGAIERMDLLKRDDPELFWQYACRDVDVTLAYVVKMLALTHEMLGKWQVAVTLGGLAPQVLLKLWKDFQIDQNQVLGTKRVKVTKYINGEPRTWTRIEDHPKKAEHTEFAANAYYGGRNEAFMFGPSEKGTITDYDLCAAYTTAMATMGVPLWDQLRIVRTLDELTLDVIGCAYVDFAFPRGTRFPCIPIDEGNSLIFPLRGQSWATAPEIVMAKAMGAKLTISYERTATGALVVPMDFSVRPFEKVTKYIKEQRDKNRETKPLLDKLFKEVGNSIYGKLAQAVHSRKLLNTRTGEMDRLGASKISNAFIAMHTTGLIRAVLAEILSGMRPATAVISTTTDGFLTDATNEEVEQACCGRIGQMFAAANERMTGERKVVETKHVADQVLCFKTRGQATLIPTSDPTVKPDYAKVILARGGIKTEAKDHDDANEEIIKLFIERMAGKPTPVTGRRGFREIYDGAGKLDFNEVKKNICYTMDFDWKRKPKPMASGVRELGERGGLHLWFDTDPMETVEEYREWRARARSFLQAGGTLQTEANLAAFIDCTAVVSPRIHRKPSGGNALSTAKKAFLRAYAQGAWGVTRTVQNKHLAGLLSSLGYKTSVDDVENAKRRSARLLEHAVRPTKEVREFIDALAPHFPTFPWERVLVPAP